MVYNSLPSGVHHCCIQEERIRCHLYMQQMTVSHTRSNITQFQANFLSKIPLLFCNQLSTFASPEYQTLFHRILYIGVWLPENRSHVLNQVFQAKTDFVAANHMAGTGNPSRGNRSLTTFPRNRTEGGSFGQMNSRAMQNEGPFSDSQSLLNSSFLSFLQCLEYF